MAKDTVSKIGNFVSDNKKPLLYIGGAIAVIAIGYAIVNRLTKGIGGAFTDKSVGVTSFKPIVFDNSKSTISNEVANTYANQLFNAMDNEGTNSSLIYDIVGKLQKKEDFLKVYNAFGRKSYYLFGSPTASAWVLGYNNLDLVEWFNQEIGYSNPLTYSLIKKTVTNAGLTF